MALILLPQYTETITQQPVVVDSSVADGDSYIDNVSMLLHAEDFTDSVNKVSIQSGNVVVSSTAYKFGSNSFLFQGTNPNFTTSSASGGFAMGTGDFTIEGWYNFVSTPTTYTWLFGDDSGNKLDLAWYVGGTMKAYIGGVLLNFGSFTPSANVWYHIALVRKSGVAYLYIDGVLNGSSASTANLTTTVLRIGAQYATSGQPYAFSGFVDEFRVTKGVARYSSAFTAPTSPFPAFVNDQYYDKVALLLTGEDLVDTTGKNALTTTNVNTSTTKYKYGTSALRMTATSDLHTNGSNSGFTMGTGEFTIEGWYNFDNKPSSLMWMFGDMNGNRLDLAHSNDGSWTAYVPGGTLALGNFSVVGNTWYHVVLMRKAGVMYLYVNGNLIGSVTSNHNIPTTALRLGAEGISGGSAFVGYVDEFRVTKGVARYPSASTITTPSGPFPRATVTSYDPYFDSVLLSLHMNGSNNGVSFPDVCGNIANVSNVVTTTAQKKYGTASGSFNGAGYLKFPGTVPTKFGGFANKRTTMEAWINPTSIPASAAYTCAVISAYDAVASDGRWVFGIIGDGSTGYSLTFIYTTGTGSQNQVTMTTKATLGQWAHIALVVDATTASSATVKLYLNGVEQQFTAQNLSTHTFSYDNFSIGGNASQYINYFNGYIDEVRVTTTDRYNQKFTPPANQYPDEGVDPYASSVSFLMHTDVLPFKDEKGTSISNVGNVALTTSGKYGSAAEFNGSNYLNVGQPAALQFGGGDFTIEMWIKPTSTNQYKTFMGQWGSSSPQYGFTCGMLTTTGNPYFQWSTNGSDVPYISATAVTNLTDGQWHHFAVTRSGTTIRLYIDGVMRASAAITGSINNAGVPVYIGNLVQPAAHYYYVGALEEIRVTKGVARYTANSFALPNGPYPDR